MFAVPIKFPAGIQCVPTEESQVSPELGMLVSGPAVRPRHEPAGSGSSGTYDRHQTVSAESARPAQGTDPFA
jgi:hypothetical protein